MRARLLLLSILALLCSCENSGDDYRYPSVMTDYACLIIDASGQPKLLRLDSGDAYPMTFTDEYREAHATLPTYENDTVYRVISIYELGADSVAYIYSMAETASALPITLNDEDSLFQSPVYLQSCWLSGGYLNMVIEIKGLEAKKHRVGFVDTTPDGMRGKEITFLHHNDGDVESYRQKLYGSVPLAPFKETLQEGDTLHFVINTYDEGVTRLAFAM